jgi:hypothetical protein
MLQRVDGTVDHEHVAFRCDSFRELGDRIARSDPDNGIAGPLAQCRKNVKSR